MTIMRYILKRKIFLIAAAFFLTTVLLVGTEVRIFGKDSSLLFYLRNRALFFDEKEILLMKHIQRKRYEENLEKQIASCAVELDSLKQKQESESRELAILFRERDNLAMLPDTDSCNQKKQSMLMQEIRKRKSKLTDLLVYYGKQHPEVVSLALLLRGLQKELVDAKALEPVENRSDSSVKIKDLDGRIRLRQGVLLKIKKSIRLTESTREYLLGRKFSKFLKIDPESIGPVFLWPVKKAAFMLAVICLGLFIMEWRDPYQFISRSLFPDIGRQIVFVLNHGVHGGDRLLTLLRKPGCETLLIDLSPQSGMFFELSSDGRYTVQDFLNRPEELSLRKLEKTGSLFYFPVRFGTEQSQVREVAGNPFFHTMLMSLSARFEKIIVHLPAEKYDDSQMDLYRMLGKVKVLSKGITRSEMNNIAPMSDLVCV